MKGWPIPAGVGGCLDTLRRTGHAAYPVGGCVRDLLLGRTPGDFDVCTDARPERVMELFPHTVPTGLRHGTVTVRTEDGPVEVTTFRREAGTVNLKTPSEEEPDDEDQAPELDETLAGMDYIPYTPQNEEEYFQQLEQWNDEDEYTRCIQALNAIPEDWRNYRIAYQEALVNSGELGMGQLDSGLRSRPLRSQQRSNDAYGVARCISRNDCGIDEQPVL